MSLGYSPAPEVELTGAFIKPFDNAIASARTCYSSRIITAEEVSKDEKARDLRDRIARETYAAGHHTVLQHASFQFTLSRVSRQLCWSFLHSHPFYNSEQVSQRYVEVKPGRFLVPDLDPPQRSVYLDAIERSMSAYQQLIGILTPVADAEYFRLFPARRKEREKWAGGVKKKAQEIARYILPVATHTHLYHTVSGLTLHRYHRLSSQLDIPLESKAVVAAMVSAVRAFDPLFFSNLEDPIPLEETLEYRALEDFGISVRGGAADFNREFDASLGANRSSLVDWSERAESTVAQSVRSVLGLTRDRLSDDQAIARVLDPAQNPYLANSLTLTTLSKLTRALSHAHYTFRKKLSHTADSQDQRHRMAPGSRPVLLAQYSGEVDAIEPDLILASPEATEVYRRELAALFASINQLLDAGVDAQQALYLLPNAFPIRFEESGDLLHLHHKWTTRLCYTAQEEIWRAAVEEVKQVERVHPRLARWLVPPCKLRDRAGVRPYCPEGPRYCGVPVWRVPLEQFQRLI